MSLAHNGVLFLDDLPEFRRTALEVLRQPLEDRMVTVARTTATVTFPADFMLVAAMNPCPCGFAGSRVRSCRCSPADIRRYNNRISGPLLDRIDLHVNVEEVPLGKMADRTQGETSQVIRARVNAARTIQLKRFWDTPL